jgi:hypothetical protein
VWGWIQRSLEADQSRSIGRHAPSGIAHGDSAGASYSDLIEAELNDESERRQGIERRAQTVISSVGAILGLSLAIASFVGLGASFTAGRLPAPSPQVVILATPSLASGIPSPAAAVAPAGIVVDPALVLIGGGGLAFLVAILSALYAMAPRTYEVAQIDALERLTEEQFWTAPRVLGSRRAAEVRVRELRFARIANARKTRGLVVALLFEVLGITIFGALALGVLSTAAGR